MKPVFSVYEINGELYVKLKDIAAVLPDGYKVSRLDNDGWGK